MSFFQEVYDRIRFATNAKTQTELAEVLEIRQSSISDAKRRDSIPPDWYIKLFDKFGLNPDWLKKNTGPMYLRTAAGYNPMEAPVGGVLENPTHYGDPASKSLLTTLHLTKCLYADGDPIPQFTPAGKISLPQSHANAKTQVFRIESDNFAPEVRKGAIIGIDPESTLPLSGEVYAMLMPHEGLVLKRIFMDANNDTFTLHAAKDSQSTLALPAKKCLERIFGKVKWVLQDI